MECVKSNGYIEGFSVRFALTPGQWSCDGRLDFRRLMDAAQGWEPLGRVLWHKSCCAPIVIIKLIFHCVDLPDFQGIGDRREPIEAIGKAQALALIKFRVAIRPWQTSSVIGHSGRKAAQQPFKAFRSRA